jgi:hypothetical protein
MSFLTEWSKNSGIEYGVLKSNYDKYLEELKQSNCENPEEEAMRMLFLDVRYEIQSPAVGWKGIICGATEPFDWTKQKREYALEQYKLNPQLAIEKGYVRLDEKGVPLPLFYDCKNENMRSNVLETSLIRTLYGIAIKQEVYEELLVLKYINDGDISKNLLNLEILKKYVDMEKLENEENISKIKDTTERKNKMLDHELIVKHANKKLFEKNSEGKTQLTEMMKKLSGSINWFDMTISNEQANPNSKTFIPITEDMYFKPFGFRAINKTTENDSCIILSSSKRTMFEPLINSPLQFDPIMIKATTRYLKITDLTKPFSVKENYRTKKKKDVETQTTNNIYATEGYIGGDAIVNQYSTIFVLDDISLGFDKDKKVTLFMPVGTEKFLGRNSKVMVFGTLMRNFDKIKKGWQYPSINVSSYYILKLVKPVEENLSIDMLMDEKTTKVENSENVVKNKELDEINKKIEKFSFEL